MQLMGRLGIGSFTKESRKVSRRVSRRVSRTHRGHKCLAHRARYRSRGHKCLAHRARYRSRGHKRLAHRARYRSRGRCAGSRTAHDMLGMTLNGRMFLATNRKVGYRILRCTQDDTSRGRCGQERWIYKIPVPQGTGNGWVGISRSFCRGWTGCG